MSGAESSTFSYLLSSPFIAGFGCGVCISIALLFSKVFKADNPSSPVQDDASNEEESSDGDGDIKLILVVRSDLKMGKGKAAAQCAHAAVLAYQQAKARKPNTLREWEENGQPKIVVKCDSEKELLELARRAKELKLITSVIKDAGRTQIAPGSRTVLGVGPGPAGDVDEVTGGLKLY